METQQKQRRRQTLLSHLPTEVICKILQSLEEFEDILASAAVCRAWRFQVETLYPLFKSIVPFLTSIDTGKQTILTPFLLLSNMENIDYSRNQSGPDHDSYILFNNETNKIHKILLPELKERLFSSLSCGWLLTISLIETDNLCLLNPFTRARIEIPPLPSSPSLFPFRPQYLRVITSTSPLDPSCVVLASHIFSNKLAFFRPLASEKRWTIIRDELQELIGYCNDSIFYKGDFYALDFRGDIFRIDLDRSILVKLPVKRVDNFFIWHYLVELNGDLLLVSKSITFRTSIPDAYKPMKLLVYKLDWQKKEWIQQKDLGNNAVLLGKHSSVSLPITQGIAHFEANCIYFVDDIVVIVSSKIPAMGVYNMETQHSEWLHEDSPIWSSPLNWFRIDRRLNSDA